MFYFCFLGLLFGGRHVVGEEVVAFPNVTSSFTVLSVVHRLIFSFEVGFHCYL